MGRKNQETVTLLIDRLIEATTRQVSAERIRDQACQERDKVKTENTELKDGMKAIKQALTDANVSIDFPGASKWLK